MKIAVVGAGLIGQSWSIVFARAGHAVALFDAAPGVATRALAAIGPALDDLARAGLLDDSAASVLARIEAAPRLRDALYGAGYVQENIAENVDAKRTLFREIGELAGSSAVLASSTSTIPASAWSVDCARRERCLVVHPVNPPHLVPLVELCPAPWTAPDVVAQAKALQEAVGQSPIVVLKELQGFVLNRLQGALLMEAFRLYAEGYASADDIDRTVRDGLGLRWSFMGPFETIDLNAPGGIVDYCARYGGPYREMARESRPVQWDEALVRKIERERRALTPEHGLGSRGAWRNARLVQLLAHRREMKKIVEE